MGNNNTSKDSHNATGSPSDFFSTPPTTPSEAQLAAMAFSSSAFNKKVEQKGTAGGTTPSTILPTTDWTRRLSASTEWAVISQNAIVSPERTGNDAVLRRGKAAGNRGRGSPSEQGWQEKDSGVGPRTGTEMTGEETTLVLLSLMEHYRASLGLSPGQDAATGAVELLRRFLVERDELLVERDELGEEVRCLKEKLKAEREEWHQFQCDLQVAVAVADRMRTEAEQALAEFQRSHRALEDQLAQTLSTQQDTDRELDGLRAQHRDACHQLALERGQLEDLRAAHMQTGTTGSDKDAERKDLSDEGQTMEDEQGGGSRGVPKEEDPEDETVVAHTVGEAKSNENHNQVKEKETPQEAHSKAGGQDANGANKTKKTQLTGKGVAETYLRSLAVLGRKVENGGSLRERRKIVMLSERSRSLSRLSLPPGFVSQNGTSQSSTLPLCKKEEPTKGRSDHIFQRQESFTNFHSKKQEQDLNLDFNKPQDGFSVLLRRHGGSRRNSLLRWCQTRTQGYKNIDITNFSSSWEDGLAFCAVYHTYLPSHIPYGSLSPANKERNLGLAFQTGEGVGITSMLTVEEMLKAGGPDWQRVLGYVDSIFRHFEM